MHFDLTSLTQGETLLGFTKDIGNPTMFELVNWILLTAKFYLHRQRLFHNGETRLISYLAEAKSRLLTEKAACAREGRPNKFKTWERMFRILSR